jgi:hypothetical protein
VNATSQKKRAKANRRALSATVDAFDADARRSARHLSYYEPIDDFLSASMKPQ